MTNANQKNQTAKPATDFKAKLAAAASKLTKKAEPKATTKKAEPKAKATKKAEAVDPETGCTAADIAAPVPANLVAPKPAPAPAAPSASFPTDSKIGQPDLTSKRLSQCALTEYRIVPSQRKSFKGYYIQGGTMSHDATRNADLFAVCVEIPHTDLAAAKKQLADLKAELAKQKAA